MNETAKEFGILSDDNDLRTNLYASAEGAARYLIWINKYVNGNNSDINNPENLKYVLAAYNAGLSRVKGKKRNHIPNIKETKDYIKDIMLMTKGDGYYIKSNDTLSKISKKFNININELIVNNIDSLINDQELKVGMVLDVSKSGSNFVNFEIKSGYNLFKISNILNIKLEDLKKFNTQIENIDLLKIGDKINIPNNKRGMSLSNV
jgi:LysM repeat protein